MPQSKPRFGVETVGTRLRAERTAQKVSRPDLAKAANMKYSTLADIENGNQASSTRLHDLCRAFPKPLRVEWLADGDGPRYALPEVTGSKDPKQAYHGVWLTRSGALLAAEWEKLDVADRADIELQILNRVAGRKRNERLPTEEKRRVRRTGEGD